MTTRYPDPPHATPSHFTQCFESIDRVPFGTHACHFHRYASDVIAALVPFTLAGLRGNERCVWIAERTLPSFQALLALRRACEGIDDLVRAGALRILDADVWFHGAGDVDHDIAGLWLDEEQRALDDGYAGLRLAGNPSFLDARHPSFLAREHQLTVQLQNRRVTALCSFTVDDPVKDDVRAQHHFEVEHVGLEWRVVPKPTPDQARNLGM